ncbi:hypothetical protein DMENIID0001_015550 [Sergentomyia squamirostris]
MGLIFDSIFYDLVAFFVFCAVGLHLYIRHTYSYWEKRNVKYITPNFPFGNLKDIMLLNKTFQQVFTDFYYSTNEKILGLYTTTKPALLDDGETILGSNFEEYSAVYLLTHITSFWETMNFREKNNIQRKDFMQLLLQLKNTGKVGADGKWNIKSTGNNATGLTFHELAAQAHSFLVAGFETSATKISFFLYEIAKHPTIQAKVQMEIDEIIKKYNGEITYEGVMEMKYLESCIDESLRMYTPLPVLNRECTEEYKLPGTGLTLEKGTRILIPVNAIHTDPKYFPEPETFKPERFLSGISNGAEIKGFTYVPFGEGPRICIGLKLGKLQTKIGIIFILSNFNIRLGERLQKMDKVVYEKKSLLLAIQGGLFLKISKRN